MHTEQQFVVFYDGACRFCTERMRSLRWHEASSDIRFVNIQNMSALARYPMVDPSAARGQMYVLSPDGSLAGGFDGIVSLLPAYPEFRSLAPLLRLPPIRSIGRAIYRWVARNRYRLEGRVTCDSGACRLD